MGRSKPSAVGGRLAVDREAGPGQRGGAQRTLPCPLVGGEQARHVALQHLDVGEEVVAERHRLRDLKVGEARHDGVGMLLGAGDQHRLQADDRLGSFPAGAPHPQPEVGRDLIVARTGGVEAPGGGADQLGQAAFDRHVDVLERKVARRAVAFELGLDGVEPGEDRRRIIGADDALVAQHGGVGARSGKILAPHPPVDRQRGVDRLHDLGRAGGEAAAPHLVAAAHGQRLIKAAGYVVTFSSAAASSPWRNGLLRCGNEGDRLSRSA